MSYCVDKAIPHSEWLSWPAEDRAKTIAYIQEDAARCSMCSTAQWEWDENPYAYEPVEEFCKGCYLKSIASEDAGKMPGTRVTLTPVTAQLRAKQWVENERRGKMNKEG